MASQAAAACATPAWRNPPKGKWRLVESEAPHAPRWVEPVSAVGRREHLGG